MPISSRDSAGLSRLKQAAAGLLAGVAVGFLLRGLKGIFNCFKSTRRANIKGTATDSICVDSFQEAANAEERVREPDTPRADEIQIAEADRVHANPASVPQSDDSHPGECGDRSTRPVGPETALTPEQGQASVESEDVHDEGEPNSEVQDSSTEPNNEPSYEAAEALGTPNPAGDIQDEKLFSADPTIDSAREIGEAESRPAISRIPKNQPAAESIEQYPHASRELPNDYLLWNRWLAEHMFLAAEPGEEVYLSITPTILAGAFEIEGGGACHPSEAEAKFADAVAAAYETAVLNSEGRLRTFRRVGSEGIPLCVGFLALSVLAAYRMHSDEEASGSAYYVRLAELLKCDMTGGHPRGFDPVVFESLWLFSKRWLSENSGVVLATPCDDVGAKRFIALPLAHVPLRRLDIERLPTFFSWAAYTPGSRINHGRLLVDLVRWSRSYAGLSASGMGALADKRRGAVVVQVAHELEAWDGLSSEPSGRRSAPIELLLDVIQYRPEISYLPRCPEGFPEDYDDGVRIFHAGGDGWYEPLQVSTNDGPQLASGFEWLNERQNVNLRRTPSRVIPLVQSADFTELMSCNSLLRGTKCAVLCQESLTQVTGEYLSATAGLRIAPSKDQNIPDGWSLFAGVVPRRRIDPPEGLEVLNVDSTVDIVFSGGLRMGRRREWLPEAPPRITVVGLDPSDITTLDGRAVQVDQIGVLQVNGQLSVPGTHIIEAGSARRTIEIVNPAFPLREMRFQPPGSLRGGYVAAIPRGRWTLIGARPDEFAGPFEAPQTGRLLKSEFRPVWAIHFGSGPGAVVISLAATPTLPFLKETARTWREIQHWASAVYAAGIRRPALISVHAPADAEVIANAWTRYFDLAKQFKRRHRRGAI